MSLSCQRPLPPRREFPVYFPAWRVSRAVLEVGQIPRKPAPFATAAAKKPDPVQTLHEVRAVQAVYTLGPTQSETRLSPRSETDPKMPQTAVSASASPQLLHPPHCPWKQRKRRCVATRKEVSGLHLLAETAFQASMERDAAHAAEYQCFQSLPPPSTFPRQRPTLPERLSSIDRLLLKPVPEEDAKTEKNEQDSEFKATGDPAVAAPNTEEKRSLTVQRVEGNSEKGRVPSDVPARVDACPNFNTAIPGFATSTDLTPAADSFPTVSVPVPGSVGRSFKKRRFTWTPELHQRFLWAINQVGTSLASPKRLVVLMKVDGLTTEHIKSHLQNHRKRLRRGVSPEDAASERGTGTLLYPALAGPVLVSSPGTPQALISLAVAARTTSSVPRLPNLAPVCHFPEHAPASESLDRAMYSTGRDEGTAANKPGSGIDMGWRPSAHIVDLNSRCSGASHEAHIAEHNIRSARGIRVNPSPSVNGGSSSVQCSPSTLLGLAPNSEPSRRAVPIAPRPLPTRPMLSDQ